MGDHAHRCHVRAWEGPSQHTRPTSPPESSFRARHCPFKSSQPPSSKSISTSFYRQLIQGAKFSYQMLIFPPGTAHVFAGGAALAAQHSLWEESKGSSCQILVGSGAGREGASSGQTAPRSGLSHHVHGLNRLSPGSPHGSRLVSGQLLSFDSKL